MYHDEIWPSVDEIQHRVQARLREIEGSPPSLSGPFLRNLFRAFVLLDEPIDLEQFPTVALNVIKCLFEANLYCYGEFDTATRRATTVFDSSVAHSRSLVEAWRMDMLEEPTVSLWKWPEPGFAMKISDFIPSAELRRTHIYETYLHPLGIEHYLFTLLLRTTDRIISVGCGRDEDDFSEENRFALMLLSPHLSTCRRHCEIRSIARAHRPIVNGDLSLTRVELVVVGRDGRVRSMSSRAAELIQRHVGEFPRCSPHLPAELQAMVARAPCSMRFGNALEVFMLKECDEVSIYLRLHEELPIETLARAVGTSPRRAEIGRYFCQGATKKEIAEKLHISPRTVDKHTEELYYQLDVSTRVEAVNELRRRVADDLRQRGEG
jgi:DNA-binding CsgD family transcriptional regulator